VNEFKSLAKALQLGEDASLASVCERLTHVTIVQKGEKDRVSNGPHSLEVTLEGMPRRCGGQGDLTAGLITSLWTWSHLPHAEKEIASFSHPASVLCAYTGCYITRLCAQGAFAKHKRSVLASHLIEELPSVVNSVFP
jgi:ATP-dependent NAD(P)H-hydrate dehydratase